jgi:hypothetical protein
MEKNQYDYFLVERFTYTAQITARWTRLFGKEKAKEMILNEMPNWSPESQKGFQTAFGK